MRLTLILIVSAVVMMVLTSCASLREQSASSRAEDAQPVVEIDPDFEKQVEQELSMIKKLEQDQQYLNDIQDEKKRLKKVALFETLSDEEMGAYGYSSNCTAWIDMAIDEEKEFKKDYNAAKDIWQTTECGLDGFMTDMEKVMKAARRRAVQARYSGLTWLSEGLATSHLPASLVQTAASEGCVGYDTANLELLRAYYGAFKHYAYAIYHAKQFEKCGDAVRGE